MSERYPRARKPVDGSHVIWAYDHALLFWASKGLSVAEIQKQFRDESSLYVGREAILTVIGGRTKGEHNTDTEPS